ncbi:MAG: ROK family protein [Lachnospiraceae bacterium]|nr:ROK family protein [Lachnospiraceae bacterium]
MKNSSDIRKENKKVIYRLMLDGKQYTKQQAAVETGLSVATCNTLLNDMQMQGSVSGEKRQLGEVGRSSVLYRIKEEHESYLAIRFGIEHGSRMVECIVFSALGRILYQKKECCDSIHYEQVERTVEEVLKQYRNITQIIVGTPGIAENGIVKYSDIPELENISLKADLEKRFGMAVSVENDMHCMAYGYCRKTNTEDDVITLAWYPSHILPGTVTIHKGEIIRGANGIAGMAGFLPYDVSRKEQLEMLAPGTCIPFIAKSLCAIIVFLNPSTIVLAGNLVTEEVLERVKEICAAGIPPEYMPQFIVAGDFTEYYYEGMFQLAVDRKGL